MPTQARIISKRNSPDWDVKVTAWLEEYGYDNEQVYGGIEGEDRADEVRKKIKTAARRAGFTAKTYWNVCNAAPGKCPYDPKCTHHVKFSFYDPEVARQYKTKQAQRQRYRT